MNRRTFCLASLGSCITGPAAVAQASQANTPRTPSWHPSFQQPLDRVIDRFRYYSNGVTDFAVFANGTCAVIGPGLSDEAAAQAASGILGWILRFRQGMTPLGMDDGNMLIQYQRPAFNVVLNDVALAHWPEIDQRHRDGLLADEVLLTPRGENVFDDFGKKALLGRCYMYLDAQEPRIVRIERRSSDPAVRPRRPPAASGSQAAALGFGPT